MTEESTTAIPTGNVLSLEEHFNIHAAVGHRTRYEIFYRLINGGNASPTGLADAPGVEDNTLHYHLNELLDVGLVEKRQRVERDQDDLDTYYVLPSSAR